MSKSDKDDIVHTCNFCGAKNTDELIDCMVQAHDGTIICEMCIIRAEAIVADREREDLYLGRIISKINESTKKKLRPIGKIPKHWLICKTLLHTVNPCVTACSPDGEEFETFSIPKQLALWIISSEEEFDLDRIRKDIKQDLIDEVTSVLHRY